MMMRWSILLVSYQTDMVFRILKRWPLSV